MLISIVIPAYNEQDVLEELHKRLTDVVDSVKHDFEVVYVDDGSTDNTLGVLELLKKSDPRVAIIELSRNFGKEIALTAGLDHAEGDATITIDADLQHPPELIPELIENWEGGVDVVYAVRSTREDETPVKRFFTNMFYSILGKMGTVEISHNSSDYRLLSRSALDALLRIREQHRFMKGLFSWIGFSQKAIPYTPDKRYSGKTKWNYLSLWNLAIEAITSFSLLPLKIATYLGIFTALVAFIFAGVVIVKKILFGDPVPGYPSLMAAILFIGGVQLITIGIIGEYLGRVFDETKRRPLYFVKNYHPAVRKTSKTKNR